MKLAIFDFDGTLFKDQTIPFLMAFYKQHKYGLLAYQMYMLKVFGCLIKCKNPLCRQYQKEQFRREATLLFAKTFNGKNEQVIKNFMKEASKELVHHLRPYMIDEIKKCKEEGYHTVILSGCYTLLLNEIAHKFNIDTVIGTDLEIHHIKKGKIAIDTLDIATGNRKVEKLKNRFDNQAIDWQQSKAYGDSVYDYDILALVGKPIAVCPDEGLLKIAQTHHWQMINEPK